MAESKLSPVSLQLQRVLPHPQEVVFDAWTQAEALSGWFAPTDEYTTIIHALDVRAGGEYRIEMRHVSGTASIVVGRYVEVRRPGRLVFTWRWQESGDDTLVTVELAKHGAGTELTLTHEKLESDDSRAKHEQGWVGCLGRLERAL